MMGWTSFFILVAQEPSPELAWRRCPGNLGREGARGTLKYRKRAFQAEAAARAEIKTWGLCDYVAMLHKIVVPTVL